MKYLILISLLYLICKKNIYIYLFLIILNIKYEKQDASFYEVEKAGEMAIYKKFIEN